MTSQAQSLPVHPSLLHPRTGRPLEAIGLRPNGDPLWPIMGGDGSEGDANDQDGGQDDSGSDEGDEDGRDDHDDQEGESAEDKRAARASRQAANYRNQLRTAERERDENKQVLDRLRQAITGEDGDGGADAGELAGQVESLSDTNSDLQRQLLVHTLAPDNGGDPNALLDSNAFMQSLRELDATQDDYRDQVAEAITAAVDKNERFRTAGQGSDRSGGELDAKNREQKRKRPTSLGGAIGAAYSGGK